MFIRFGATRERDRRTDTQTPHADIRRAYASHRAAKIVILDQYLAIYQKRYKIQP